MRKAFEPQARPSTGESMKHPLLADGDECMSQKGLLLLLLTVQKIWKKLAAENVGESYSDHLMQHYIRWRNIIICLICISYTDFMLWFASLKQWMEANYFYWKYRLLHLYPILSLISFCFHSNPLGDADKWLSQNHPVGCNDCSEGLLLYYASTSQKLRWTASDALFYISASTILSDTDRGIRKHFRRMARSNSLFLFGMCLLVLATFTELKLDLK